MPSPRRLAAAQLLERGAVSLGARRRASQLAGLVGAFAAMRLRPPRLLAAVAEVLKLQQRPSPLALLGPWESVVVVWAFGRLGQTEDAAGPGGGDAHGVGGGGDNGGGAGPAAAARPEGRPAALVDEALWELLLDRATTLVRLGKWVMCS